MRKTESKKNLPYNVLKNPLAKVALATTLLTGAGAVSPIADNFNFLKVKRANAIDVNSATSKLTPKILGALNSNGYGEPRGLFETSDGGFVVAGRSNATNLDYTNKGGYEGYIAKFDQHGNKQWIQGVGGSGFSDTLTDVTQLSDGSYIASGFSDSSDAGFPFKGGYQPDAIIVKFDSSGNILWIKNYGGSDLDELHSIKATADGGAIAVGRSVSTNAGYSSKGSEDAIAIKIDANGNQQWIKNFGGNQNDHFYDVIVNKDGTYTFVGNSNNMAYIVKVSATGSQLFAKTFGTSTGYHSFYGITQTPDGGFVAVGSTGKANETDAVIVKYDSNGNQKWSQKFGPNGAYSSGYQYKAVRVMPNGDIRAAGYFGSSDYGYVDYDANGSFKNAAVSQMNLQVTGYEKGMIITADGGIVSSGWVTKNDYYKKIGLLNIDIKPASGSISFLKMIQDDIKPTLNISISETKPTNKSVTVDVLVNEENLIETKLVKKGIVPDTVLIPGNWFTSYYFSTDSQPFDKEIVITENGEYGVYVKDAAGNETVEKFVVNNIDTTPPVDATFSPSTTDLTNGDVTVTIGYPADAEVKEYKISSTGTWKEYSSPIVLSTNETIFARSKDSAGNISNETNYSINNIDKVAPTTPVLKADNVTATKEDIAVEISYTIDSVIKEYRINGGAWTNYSGTIIVTENSKVEARGTDLAGNVSAIGELVVANIDKDAPIITLTPNKTAPTNVAVEVDIDVIDNNPIVEKKWAKGNHDETFFNTAGTDVVGDVFNVNENGIYTVFAKDSAGNTTVKTITVSNIDMDSPTITLIPTKTAPTNVAIDVDVEIIDNNAIIEKKWAEGNQNEAFFNSGGTLLTGDVFNVSKNGTYTVFAKDSAGNTSLQTITITNIDIEKPTITLKPSTLNPTNAQIDVDVQATDNVSIVELKWAKGNQSVEHFSSNGTNVTNNVFHVSDNGMYTVYAKDSAGNETVEVITINNLDFDAPIITLTPNKTAPTNVAIEVDIDIIDNNPIVEKKWAKGNLDETFFNTAGTEVVGDVFNVNENGIYTVFAKDSAGNTTVKTITVSNIDMDSPIITLIPTKTAPTNVAIDVDVEIIDNNAIIEKKWAEGNRDEAYFSAAGTILTNDVFNVSKNGTYTVFAKDSAGNTSLQTITVTNIDMEKPTITLKPSTLNPTNAQIEVDVQATDNVSIVELKWAEGNQTAGYFSTNGTDISNNVFQVSENGMYSVYAKDSAGNETVEVITINNLDFDAPVITLIPETVDPINTAIHVDVEVVDGNPIIEKKWAKGSQDIAYFKTNGTIITGDQFLVSDNDIYTVYAIDAAGNESIEFITVSNLDFDNPDKPTITLDNTAPTNKEVTVTINYPTDAHVKEFKVGATGTWKEYTGPIKVSTNTEVFARAKDRAGNYSDEENITISNIDLVAPVITVSGVVDGDTYVNEATPSFNVIETNNFTTEVTLNGKLFTDTTIKDSGSYIYTVKATDEAGNVTVETISFHVNHTPTIVSTLNNKSLAKFKNETIDLSTLFQDTEGDKLTYTVTSSNPNEVEVTVTNSTLEIEALKQGKSTITITASDKYSTSQELKFEVEVSSFAPILNFVDEETKIVGKEDSVTIKGTVKDEDKEDVTVTVTLNNITKSIVVPTTGADDSWSITFDKDELTPGVYTIKVNAQDPFSATADLSSNDHIVKLIGTPAEYELTLSGYEKDINKDRQDFTKAEHEVLLEAYIAVDGLKTTNTPDEWLKVKPKVDALADGTVKDSFYKSISGNALDYLKDNIAQATKSDYETAGMKHVQGNLVPEYNVKVEEYLTEKGDLSSEEIQLIIDIVNAIEQAQQTNDIDDWKDALKLVGQLDDGKVKDSFLQDVENGFLKSIELNPFNLNEGLLENFLNIPIHANLEGEYQVYLTDVLVKQGTLTKPILEQVIEAVDKVQEATNQFKADPTQTNLTEYENTVKGLVDGNYKSSKEDKFPEMNLEMVVHYPTSMTAPVLDTIGVTYDVNHIPLYQDFLGEYLKDVKKETITKVELQLIIDVVNAVEQVKNNPTDDNIQRLNDLLAGLDPNAQIVKDTKQQVNGSILDTINGDFTNVTEKQLENIGITDLITSRLPQYQDALEEYAKEHDPKDLTVDDIQKVIDAINGVQEAKENPSADTIRNAHETVNELDNGTFKDKLLQELEDITIEYIVNNPGAITEELLDFANLDTDSSRIDSYIEYLNDVIPGMAKPVSKDQLQELIDMVDSVWKAYYQAINTPSKPNVLSYETAVHSLEDGIFKTKMTALIDDVALVYLIASPSTQEKDDYIRVGMSIDENNLSAYNKNMAKYINDIGSSNFTFTEVGLVISVTDKVETALDNSSTPNVQQALQAVRTLENGELKTELLADLNGEVMDSIILNPDKVTADDLVNLGLDNVNPALEKEYQDALTKLKDDLGGNLTFNDVQNAIDAVNAVEKALNTGNTEDIQKAIDAINKLPDGSLKDDLLNKIKDIVIEDIIKNPSDVTSEKLAIGGFDKVDSSLEEQYKENLLNYISPLTKEAIQQVVDIVNHIKKTKLDLTLDDRNKLSDMVSLLEESVMKENLKQVYNTLNQLYSTEQSFNQKNVRQAFEEVALVTTSDKTYLEQMAKSFAQVLTAIVEPSDNTVALAQAELIKLEDGQLKSRFQTRVGGAYLEHVITTPGSSDYTDWINAGFEDVIEADFDSYKGAIGSITDEVGQLTKEQIQSVIDAINAMNQAKKTPNKTTIEFAKEKIKLVVDSKWKDEALAEMEALWKSIQPKPQPPVNEPPVVNKPIEKPVELVLPKPSDKVMVVENKYAAVVMEIPQIEVSETSELKVKIKIHAKDLLNGSKLYIHANSAGTRGLGAATNLVSNPGVQIIGANGKVVEIDLGKMDKGVIEVDRDLVFGKDGEYLLKGVFVANGTNLETNTVKVSVYKDLAIPNTILPNVHGMPVATMKANEEIGLFKLDKDGNFIRSGKADKGSLHLVYDTYRGYYKLADGFYAAPSKAITVHIGKGEIRKDSVNVYDKNGRFIRTIKKGQQYKVYSYDDKRYSIGGGEFIEVQDGVTYVFGWMTITKPMTLYKPDGTAERTLKAGEKYRIYRADDGFLHVGGGYKVKRELSKFTFLKN
ncbi:MAG: hypothetical protein ABS939_00475 [Psychrobacillus sp.]